MPTMDAQQTADYNALLEKFSMRNSKNYFFIHTPESCATNFPLVTDAINCILLEATPNNFGNKVVQTRLDGVITNVAIHIGFPHEGTEHPIIGPVTIGDQVYSYKISTL